MNSSGSELPPVRPIQWVLTDLIDNEKNTQSFSNPFENALPNWAFELQAHQYADPTTALHELVPSLAEPIQTGLINHLDISPIDTIFRYSAALHILHSHDFPAIDKKIIQEFIGTACQSLKDAGAELKTFPEANLAGDYLGVCTGKGILGLAPMAPDDLLKQTEQLSRQYPEGQVFRFGESRAIGLILTNQGQTYYYPLTPEHWFAIGCAATGNYTPHGSSTGRLLHSRQYFPFVGALAKDKASRNETESGLSWWKIPRLTPIDMPFVTDMCYWGEEEN